MSWIGKRYSILILVIAIFFTSCFNRYKYSDKTLDEIYEGYIKIEQPYSSVQIKAVEKAMSEFVEMKLDTANCLIVLMEDSVTYLVEYIPEIPEDSLPKPPEGSISTYCAMGAIVILQKSDYQVIKTYVTG